MIEKPYSQLMRETNAYITITLDLDDPIEIGDFADMFAGLGGQFDAFLQENYPDLKGKAQMFIKEVRHGSTIVDLVPNIPDLVGYMDNVLVVGGFASLFSRRVRNLISGNFAKDAKKSDLKEIGETIRAVSNNSGGDMRLETVKFEQGVWSKKLELGFDTKAAREAQETIAEQKKSLDAIEHVDHQRVLMTLERSRKSDSDLNQPTGELVIIEEISTKPKALIYASNLVEQTIKHEIREADDNIYKKGFVVDANVRMKSGRVVGYAVVHVHQVIDLPDN